MQNIELENIRPQIKVYIKDTNPAEKIAGLFYYSSAAILWTAGMLGVCAILFGLLFSPGMTLSMVILGLICGFPGWIWAGMGFGLYCWHKKHYKYGLPKSEAAGMWLSTILFNGFQAAFIFNCLSHSPLANVVAGWNLIVAALSIFALYFEFKLPGRAEFR